MFCAEAATRQRGERENQTLVGERVGQPHLAALSPDTLAPLDGLVRTQLDVLLVPLVPVELPSLVSHAWGGMSICRNQLPFYQEHLLIKTFRCHHKLPEHNIRLLTSQIGKFFLTHHPCLLL